MANNKFVVVPRNPEENRRVEKGREKCRRRNWTSLITVQMKRNIAGNRENVLVVPQMSKYSAGKVKKLSRTKLLLTFAYFYNIFHLFAICLDRKQKEKEVLAVRKAKYS